MEEQASELLDALGMSRNNLKSRSTVQSQLVIATVDSNYSGSGRPKLLFAGSSIVGSATYPYLSSYTPAANDRVIVVLFSHSGCILGKIV